MPFYIKLLILFGALTLILAVLYLVYKKCNEPIEKYVLRFPRVYRIVPFSLFCFTVICSVCILLFQFEEWPYILILIGFFGMPGLIMFIMWSLWKVDIKEESFVYRNFFGKKYEYCYGDLKYQMHPKGLKWYFYKNNKKVFCMAYYIKNEDLLEKTYRKHISKIKNV